MGSLSKFTREALLATCVFTASPKRPGAASAANSVRRPPIAQRIFKGSIECVGPRPLFVALSPLASHSVAMPCSRCRASQPVLSGAWPRSPPSLLDYRWKVAGGSHYRARGCFRLLRCGCNVRNALWGPIDSMLYRRLSTSGVSPRPSSTGRPHPRRGTGRTNLPLSTAESALVGSFGVGSNIPA